MADSGVAARHYKAAVNQECLLLWQISQLDYVCGNVHIDLSELIDIVNYTYSFIGAHGQTAVEDALVDEAGEPVYHDC